jgi:hypothetical protein
MKPKIGLPKSTYIIENGNFYRTVQGRFISDEQLKTILDYLNKKKKKIYTEPDELLNCIHIIEYGK